MSSLVQSKIDTMGRFLSKKNTIFFLWILIPLIAGIKHATRGVFNDYLIYKSVFYNTIKQANLYLNYPELNGDSNHYGPFFSLVFAPFALLSDQIGTILWDVAMNLVLFWAIYKLPIKWNLKVIIYYICLQGVYANAVNSETNSLIAALIIGSFLCIKKDKSMLAAFFIAFGVFIKLYTIVGLAFFFFSKSKIKFIGYIFLWGIVFFFLPMLISSPQFIIQSYFDWYNSLAEKNILNLYSMNQDISVMGLIRRVFNLFDLNNLVVIIPALCLFALQYIRIDKFEDLRYQLGILASTLLFVVLFSTGTEPCTYIIATVGASIWIILQTRPYKKYVIVMIAFVLLAILLSSGIVPRYIRTDIVKKYALEVLPFFIIWLILIYQLIFGSRSIYSNEKISFSDEK